MKNHSATILKYLFSVVFIFFVYELYAQNDENSVFFVNRGKNREWLSFSSNYDALYRIISNEAFKHLENRKNLVTGLSTKADWQAYQNTTKQKLRSSLSKFEKTALNPKITGVLERENFKVEKVIFESHPGFFVTSCLFIPNKRQNPAPAIIYCSGHNVLGFRGETYQHIILNLVEKGFVVLAFDPIGQGERLQYLDMVTGKSVIGSSTQEHSYAGIQTLFTGTSLADYFIWDGIRAIDFLSTRSEVDMNRIGITGRSGGGTQAAMIAACDDRILAVAPENYITNFKRLFQAIGPQDAEQNPWFGIARGIDHPDFFHARAPKPSLIISTTNDYFSIQGARETFDEVKRSYSAFGMAENVQMVEDFGKHETTVNNRQAMYSFFQKHLSLQGNNEDVGTRPFDAEELWVTLTGQVGSSMPCHTIFDLSRKYSPETEFPKDRITEKLQELSGIEFNRKLTSAVFTGNIVEDNMTIEKYFLENQLGDYALPVFVIRKKETAVQKTLVWLHPEGKERILHHNLLTELLDAGYTIISADLPGIGELRNPDFTGDGTIGQVPFNYVFGANLVGKSIPGIQAEGLDLLTKFIMRDTRFNNNELHALVEGTSYPAFLLYNTLKNKFTKTLIFSNFKSGKNLLDEQYYDPTEAFHIIPGSLFYFTFDDILMLLPENSIKILDHDLSSGSLSSQKDEIKNYFLK